MPEETLIDIITRGAKAMEEAANRPLGEPIIVCSPTMFRAIEQEKDYFKRELMIKMCTIGYGVIEC